jgi:hypothetical protein
MSKNLFPVTMLILLIFIFSQAAFNRSIFVVAASQPSSLKIYVGPPSILADNNFYDAIFVQLQDSEGLPCRARQDTIIRLSSSQTNIGSVDPEITVPAGLTYAVAQFNSTYTPGSTTITAAASGYMTVQASITTVGPVPSKLAVYSFPPAVPADGGSYPAIIVQLQDPNGIPAKAPIGDVNVTLSSSNTVAGTVDPLVVIKGGTTYAVATFNTTTTPASAVITAQSSGYSSGQATITTQQIGGQPTNLMVYVGPPTVPADGVTYDQVAVQLQDSSGRLAQASSDVAVTLSSSNTAVGTVEPNITINYTEVYAVAEFYSTYSSGTTIITAAATNYTSSQGSLTTVGPVPSKLAVYCVPSSLPADGQVYDAIVVQLQDSEGNPAKDPVGNITVYLFSSVPEAGNVSSTVVIPLGKTYSTGSFFSTYTPNSTTVTAQTSGYDPGQATLTTYLIDQYTLNVSVTAQPATINSTEQTTVTAYVTYDGTSPTLGATVNFTSDNGGTFSAATDETNGYYTSVFTAPTVTAQTVCTITANASKPGYNTGQGNVQVTVNSTVQTGSILLQIEEDNGNPVSDASVTSTSQPSGISPLNGIANEGGYMEFNNVLEGSYTMQITKSGYYTKNETISVTAGQTTVQTITLLNTPSPWPSTPIVIAIIAAVIIAVAIIALVLRKYKISFSREAPSQEAGQKG